MEQPANQGQPIGQPSPGGQAEPLTRRQRRERRRQEKQAARRREERTRKAGRVVAWLAVLAVLGGAVALVVFLGGGDGATTAKLAGGLSADDHVKGPEEAPVTLIEYSDFQCPACGSFFPIVQQLLADNPDTIRFAYRHFPLRSLHRNAQRAGEWAEAAGMQGKFFEFHDLLFERQSEWANDGDPTDAFRAYGEQLGLDVDRLAADAKSGAARDRVNADYASGTSAGVNATPTFFLDGERIVNPRSLAEFQALVDDAAAAAASAPTPAPAEGGGAAAGAAHGGS